MLVVNLRLNRSRPELENKSACKNRHTLISLPAVVQRMKAGLSLTAFTAYVLFCEIRDSDPLFIQVSLNFGVILSEFCWQNFFATKPAGFLETIVDHVKL
jgi:hypothetical protein